MLEEKNHLNFEVEEEKRNTGFFNIMVFVAIFFLCTILISFALNMVESSYGMNLNQLLETSVENPTLEERNFVRWNGFISQFFGFLLPGVIFSIFIYKTKWVNFLHINKIPKLKNILLGIALIFSSLPFAYFLYWINLQIPLPQSLIDTENQTENFINMMLVTDHSYELIFSLIIMAVLPAIGEEIIFRGILQKGLTKSTKNAHIAIWITAIIFSAIHFQFEGFLIRMFLGVLLGYLFFWTNNLWIPILAHFAHNASQVVGVYMEKNGMIEANFEDPENSIGWLSIVISIALMSLFIFYLKKEKGSEL